MTAPTGGLDRRYRLLLRCYPRAWRRAHEDAMVGVLLDHAEAEGRAKVGVRAAADLVGHGLEARLDHLLRRLPDRLRRQIASAALVAAAGTSLLLLVGEVIGARYRPPVEEITDFSRYFISGPFLTIGVGLDFAFMTAALLVVMGRPGLARFLLIAGSAYALWMVATTGTVGYPMPRTALLVMGAGLGLLASLTTLELVRPARRRLVGAGMGFVGAVALGLLATRPLLQWSIGTMTSSGNVTLAALAVVLAVVSGGTILLAAARAHRSPGWPAALAVTAFPVVVCAAMVSVVVNPVQLPARALIPAAYLVAVVLVAATVRRGRRRRVTAGR